MARVALMTTGVMAGREDDPGMYGFFARTGINFATAESSPGFCAVAGYDDANPWHIGARPPLFAGEEYAGRIADTLSVWTDLESVFAFAYNGVHAEALSHRRQWFVKGEWPTYVAWWVDDDHMPTWEEAYARHALLQRDGSTPAAFNFTQAFDAAGQPCRIDREAVMRLSGQPTREELGHP